MIISENSLRKNNAYIHSIDDITHITLVFHNLHEARYSVYLDPHQFVTTASKQCDYRRIVYLASGKLTALP
jgi:hypothetical protein